MLTHLQTYNTQPILRLAFPYCPAFWPQDKERGVVKLSPEEGRKKAEELMRKAKERRDKEEKVSDVLREKERIRSGELTTDPRSLVSETASDRFICLTSVAVFHIPVDSLLKWEWEGIRSGGGTASVMLHHNTVLDAVKCMHRQCPALFREVIFKRWVQWADGMLQLTTYTISSLTRPLTR